MIVLDTHDVAALAAQAVPGQGALVERIGQLGMGIIGGVMKTSSRFALAAAASVLLGAALTPARAADLGGGCCGDLEERVAELEATTARKGNRVVSLQVYGQVNKGLLIWDDGVNSDAFVVDNAISSSRFGLVGKAQIKPGWTAGYNMEFEILDARNNEVFDGKNGDDPEAASTLKLRHNNFYVESDRLGRITVGQQSTAADGANEIVVANSLRNADTIVGNGFKIQNNAGSSTTLKGWASHLGGGRDDVIRYDSPSIYGFVLSASWGDNDYADAVLRFKKEFSSFRLAAALAYQWDSSDSAAKYEQLGGSISVMHVPTGLYAAFAAASRDRDNLAYDQSFWYVQGGIEKKLLPYGTTTVYGEYAKYDDIKAKGSEATRLGFGVVQKIDSAAMDVYAQATFWSFDDNSPATYEDLSLVMIGSRIKF